MSITKKLRYQVFHRDHFTCKYCGHAAPDVVLEVDHVTPRSAGGGDELGNLVTACYACNRGKSAAPLDCVACEAALHPLPEEVWPMPTECVGGPLDGREAEVRYDDTVLWCFVTTDGHRCIASYLCTAHSGRQYLGHGSVEIFQAYPHLRAATLAGFYVYSSWRTREPGAPRRLEWMTAEDLILRRIGAL